MMDVIPISVTFEIQFLSLGFYQLSRLHYCFSRDRVHSDKGYPFWAFTVMISIGIVMSLSWILNFIIVEPLTLKCGFGAGSESFFMIKQQNAIALDGMVHHFYLSIGLCTQIWDITTLLMYIYKIWKIGTFYKSRNDNIWNNIRFVLHRIVITTLFYLITTFLMTMIMYIIASMNGLQSDDNIGYTLQYGVTTSFTSILWSLSICLMMEHNMEEYGTFLRFCRRIFFCCGHHIIDRQLRELETETKELGMADQARKSQKVQPDLTVSTNASTNENYRIPNPRKSVETITVIIAEKESGEVVNDT